MSRVIEFFLRPFFKDEDELIQETRIQIWKAKWFPYRTAEFLGFDEETNDLKLGPWKWNKPDILRKRR